MDMGNVTFLIVSFAVSVIGFLIISAIYAREGTPLRKVPGPVLASFSRWWMVMKTRKRDRHVYDAELHKKYGPVVRIGPTYVMVSSPDAVKTIYGAGSGFVKDSWYKITADSPNATDQLDMLSETNMEKYRLQRRLFGPIYSTQQAKDYEANLDEVIRADIATMNEMAGTPKSVDLWFNYMVADFLSASTFSKYYGLVQKGDDDGSIHTIHSWWYFYHWAGFVPRLARFLQQWNAFVNQIVPVTTLRKRRKQSPAGSETMFSWAHSQLQERRQEEKRQEHHDIAQRLLDLEITKPQWKDHWTTNLVMTNFGAGVETTGAVLSEVIVQAISNPGVQSKIQEEIDRATAEGRLSDPAELGQMQRELPYLQACLEESLRLHSIIGTMVPRVVPPSGVTIDGYFIPGGTTIGINPWVLSRDESLYGEDADKFRPERWLEMSHEEKLRLEKYAMWFGTSARSCPGQYVAQAIMSKILPVMFRNFEWSFKDPSAKRKLETTFTVRYINVMVTWKSRNLKQ